MRGLSAILISAALASLAPASARACAVCATPDPQSAGAYLEVTLMMIALPLGLIGGLAYWLTRCRRHSEADSAVNESAGSKTEIVSD